MKLPDSLSRAAVINTFRKITPVAWEKLFEREDLNGLAKLRVPGDFQQRAYYSTEGLIHWLVRNNRYGIDEVSRIGQQQTQQTPSIRTHVLAG